jgi:hypothetical protein
MEAGIVVTNDGNAILRELDIAHPAAKASIINIYSFFSEILNLKMSIFYFVIFVRFYFIYL